MKSAFDSMFFILVGLALLGNIYFFKMKFLLKEKGHPMSFNWGRIRDLWNMAELIKPPFPPCSAWWPFIQHGTNQY